MLVQPRAIRNAFPLLSWAEQKAAARKQLDPWQLHRRRVHELVTRVRTQELVSAREIGALYGVVTPEASEIVAQPSFPDAVATLSGTRAWRTDQVLAHLQLADEVAQADEAGDAPNINAVAPREEPAEDDELMAATLYDSAQLTALLGLADGVVLKYVCGNAWQLLPKPSGRVGGVHYWKHSVVNSWLMSPEGVAATRRRDAQRERA